MTRACSRAGEVGAAWEYISRVIRSIVKKPVRSSRWRSGLRILDNIDGVINRGGESRSWFSLSLVGRSVETQRQTRILSRHIAMRNIDRMEKRMEDGSSATLFTYYTRFILVYATFCNDMRKISNASLVVRSLFRCLTAPKIEKLRRLENAAEFPLSQGPVTFPSSSLLPPRSVSTRHGRQKEVAA